MRNEHANLVNAHLPALIPAPHFEFNIPNSAFRTSNSAFLIPHFEFRLPHSLTALAVAQQLADARFLRQPCVVWAPG